MKRVGAQVTEVVAYQTEKPKGLRKQIAQLFRHERVDFITFTSASTAQYFFEALPTKKLLKKSRLISIGPETSKAIRSKGKKVDQEAKVHTLEGLVQAILKRSAK